ncbi:hypothetical protein [Poriferisphaera sp. WC338]|uniref:hypothetical protein n=1 Tax=Poriferisphaera sp. WC338 TaxID=3425129 RepID=UPI003D815CE5
MVLSGSQDSFVERSLGQLLGRLDRESRSQQMAQRAESRHNVHAPAQLGMAIRGEDGLPTEFKGLYRAWVTDVSSAGLGMLLEHDMPRDVVIWANVQSLYTPEETDVCSHILPIRVAYCMRLLPTTFRVGGAFVRDVSSIPDSAWLGSGGVS